MRPPMPSMVLSRRAKIALSVVAALVVLLIVLVQLSGVYINYLWYGSVGQRGVYSTVLWTKVTLFLAFGALMALIIGGNLVVAYVVRPPFRPMSPEQQNLQNYALMIEPRRKLILIGVSLIAFLAAGASAQSGWGMWQLWLHGGPFGTSDPLFGLDISFYAWDYPVYRSLLSFGFTAVIVSLLLSVVVHYLTGAIRLQTPGPKMTIAARRHITVLVFVFMALKAVAYWLDRYGLVFSTRSKFTGASYTDVHSALPAKTILFWIAVVLALGVLASMWLRSALLPGIGFVVLMVLSILIGGIYPAVVQSVSVNPNASDKERPYIRDNIVATRQAYGIVTSGSPHGVVSYKQYPATANPANSALTSTNTTVDNIRILDPNVVSPTFTNQQKIAYPYGFSPKLNVDRYTLGGVTHDYIVAVRELQPRNLAGPQNNWINQYTVYTHGYGFVAAQANKDVTKGDTSDYTEGDIPPVGPLNITRPQIYYGQGMNSYAIVGAKGTKREFDGNVNDPTITYQGKGGVSLSNFFTRLAFTLKYKQTNFLLNNAVSAPGARIILNRDPRELVQKVAPFLTVDGDPYPVVNQQNGHIMWVVDGYTTMANYPYSERQSLAQLTGTSQRQDQANTRINYIRNSVKATVDAYDGTVKLYDWQPDDPVLQAWMNVFPGLVHPASQMPVGIREHVRYPQDLFNVQRALLAQYHISDPVAFYNGRGKWAVPKDPFNPAAGDQPPYYVLATPPGTSSDAPEFQLTTPMTVNNADNLAAYVSVDCDYGPNYGHFTVLEVPTKSTIQGPKQVANVFKSNPRISSDITLLGSGQSIVVHGNLLTLPVGNSFLYVEPLYVQATYPTLARVLVTYGNHIGYGATLSDALDDIRKNRAPGSTLDTGQAPPPTNSSPPPPPTTPPPNGGSSGTATVAPPPGSTQRVLHQLDQAYADYAAAKNKAQVSQALARILNLLDQYHQITGQSPPPGNATPTPSPTPTG